MDTDLTAQAWAFVLRHQKMIRRYARKWGSVLNEDDKAEMEQNLILRVVERFPSYDPAKSAPSTWIGWQARAVQTYRVREFAKMLKEGVGTHRHGRESMVMIPIGPASWGSAEHATDLARRDDAPAVVAGLYTRANHRQKLAMRATLAAPAMAASILKQHKMTNRERLSCLRELRPKLEN